MLYFLCFLGGMAALLALQIVLSWGQYDHFDQSNDGSGDGRFFSRLKRTAGGLFG